MSFLTKTSQNKTKKGPNDNRMIPPLNIAFWISLNIVVSQMLLYRRFNIIWIQGRRVKVLKLVD